MIGLSASRANGRRGIVLHVGATAILIGLVLLVYQPSRGHTHRGDQWCVLLDGIDQDGFFATFMHTFSYNRTRAVDPGDYQLFRPVLFALLSAEKALFGNNLALWQWVGIALHGVAVCLFLAVLLAIRRLFDKPQAADRETALAYALALFFALNFAGVEMVIWSHINGYLLFVVFALAAVRLCLPVLGSHPCGAVRLLAIFSLLLLAAFTYEIGSAFAVVAGMVVGGAEYRRGRRGRGMAAFALLASIFPVYQGINFLDRLAHPGALDGNLQTIADRVVSWPTVEHAWRYFLYTAVQPFFPSRARWEFRGRVVVHEPAFAWPTEAWTDPVPIVSLLVCAAGLFLAARGLVARRGNLWPLLAAALPVSLYGLHALAVVLGRMNLRPGPLVVASNSYYAYLPLLAFLAAVYVLWVCAPLGGLTSPARLNLLVGLVVLAAAGGKEVHRINVAVKTALKPERVATRTLAQFIDNHQRERDFSIAVDPSCAWSAAPHGIPFPIVLFKRYVNNHNPKYVFRLIDGKPIVLPAAAGLGCGGQLYPDLVRVDTDCNFFSFRGRYYGVPWKEGYYAPGRAYTRLIAAETLQDAVERAARNQDRAAAGTGEVRR